MNIYHFIFSTVSILVIVFIPFFEILDFLSTLVITICGTFLYLMWYFESDYYQNHINFKENKTLTKELALTIALDLAWEKHNLINLREWRCGIMWQNNKNKMTGTLNFPEDTFATKFFDKNKKPIHPFSQETNYDDWEDLEFWTQAHGIFDFFIKEDEKFEPNIIFLKKLEEILEFLFITYSPEVSVNPRQSKEIVKLAHYIEFKTCFFEILDKRYDFEKNTPWQRKKVKGGYTKHQRLVIEEKRSRFKEDSFSIKNWEETKKKAALTLVEEAIDNRIQQTIDKKQERIHSLKIPIPELNDEVINNILESIPSNNFKYENFVLKS